MVYREACVADIGQIMRVRMSVNENVLVHTDLVTPEACETYIVHRGKGWVCDVDGQVVGFAIADLKDHNIWALFVHPQWEGRGIGKTLHDQMLDWYFWQTKETVWLTTAPHTRAEMFYRKSGWDEVGRRPNGEVHFEMSYNNWQQQGSKTFSNTHI